MLLAVSGCCALMPLSIKIDNREVKLIPLIRARLQKHDHLVQVCPLDIGDVEICNTDPDYRIIFERKCEKDLGASLKDGRYQEQKARILATVPPHHCMYLIENAHIPTWGPGCSTACSPSAYTGVVVNSMFRDGIHVAITRDTSDTADWICAIFDKCMQDPSKYATSAAPRDISYLNCVKIKTKKLENIDVKTCFLMQLAQIPGLSAKLATAVAEQYTSWRKLIHAMDAAFEKGGEEEAVAMLSTISLIGSKKARRIVDYLKDYDGNHDKCQSE